MKKQSLYRQCMGALRQHRFILLVLSVFVNILVLVTAIYMLQIYDRVLTSGSLDTLLWLTVMALFALAIYGVLEQARRLILARSAQYLESHLSAPVLRHHMDSKLAGTPPKATIRDVADLRNYYRSDGVLALQDAPWALVFLALIWLLHPVLGMVAIAGAGVLLAAAVTNDLLTRKGQGEVSAKLRSINEQAVLMTGSGETISPLGMAPTMFARWRGRQDAVRTAEMALAEITTTILAFSRSFRLGLQVLILGVGAYFVLGGDISSGTMIAASIIMSRALSPIERATAGWRGLIAARSARKRLDTLFGKLANRPEQLSLPKPVGAIKVENVFYTAPAAGQPILKAINFELEAGTTCAIVGDSGAGKSTLCRLLTGAWVPTAGNVRLDGAALTSWSPDNLGAFIGYLPQAVEMFPGTVAQNIARFRDCDDAQVLAAARMAGVHDMILHLPNGYDTQIGDFGHRISQGQRQRIGLARAVFGDPSFVVLDEPNANLDHAGDLALLEALHALQKRECTVVVVSHRAKVLRVADKIAVLNNGQLARFGDAEEFLRPSVGQASRAPAHGTLLSLAPGFGVTTNPKAAE